MFRHLFVIDPIAKLNLRLDSSLQIARHLLDSGDAVEVCDMATFQWATGAHCASALCRVVRIESAGGVAVESSEQRRMLAEFDLIHMRKDPPFDIDYVAATWFLDSAGPSTRILNHPDALRSLNEKLVTLRYPDDTVPTLVTSNASELMNFFHTHAAGDMIVKPFDMFGGHGIIRLVKGERSEREIQQELLELTQSGGKLRIAQPFQPAIFDGEVRCFAFGADPIAWTLKRPANGSFMANTRLGATLEKYQPTGIELERVRRIGKELSEHGVWMIGFDMIGGRITEINLTSPRLLSVPGEMVGDHRRLATKIRDWLKP
jgi:glutathione synthase